jgi:palmitoyltransferase
MSRVTFTVLLISFISYSSQIFLIWPWYGSVLSVDLLKLLLPFKYVSRPLLLMLSLTKSAAVFMVFWNYRLCVITPPGGVPVGWACFLDCYSRRSVLMSSARIYSL